MKKNLPLKGLTFVLTATYGFASASANIIDDFNNAATGSNISLSSDFLGDSSNIALIRDTPAGAGFTISGGKLHYDANNATTPAALKYHFNGPYDMSLNPALKLNFENISADFTGTLVLTSTGGHTLTFTDFDVNNSDLTPTLNFSAGATNGSFSDAAITAIQLTPNSGNLSVLTYSLDSVEAVPEPFSMLTMGAGVAAFVKNRRKKLSKTSA